MTACVLKSKSDIEQARNELRQLGISCDTPWLVRKLRYLGLLGGVDVGDHVKSWDVSKTVRFLQEQIQPTDTVLDIGAFSSETLPALHRLGFSALTGIDLNPKIGMMPYAETIRYQVADFMRTPFEDRSFGAITAISVIEHGFDGKRLLAEVSRLLRPGGYFIASFDYWPEKVDTTGIKIFGMDWTIFSRDDVQEFIRGTADYGLVPCGEIDLDADDKVIKWGGKEYTFAWIALRKR